METYVFELWIYLDLMLYYLFKSLILISCFPSRTISCWMVFSSRFPLKMVFSCWLLLEIINIPLISNWVFSASACFLCEFDVLFLMHNALLKMLNGHVNILKNEHVNIFGHSNLKMTETWCWTLCSKVWYWYHIFRAEQSYVEWFFRADTFLAFANFLFSL